MKLFTRTKLLGPIALVVVSAGGGTAFADGHEEASKEAQAPSQCPGMDESEGSESNAENTSPPQ